MNIKNLIRPDGQLLIGMHRGTQTDRQPNIWSDSNVKHLRCGSENAEACSPIKEEEEKKQVQRRSATDRLVA